MLGLDDMQWRIGTEVHLAAIVVLDNVTRVRPPGIVRVVCFSMCETGTMGRNMGVY